MINEINLNKIRNAVGAGKDLTTNVLICMGFTKNDLTILTKNGILNRVKRGHYSFEEKLQSETVEAVNDKKKNTNPKNINVENEDIYFEIMLESIKKENYNIAIEEIGKLLEIKNSLYTSDAKFYLYLLSFFVDLPDKYKELVKQIEMVDIFIGEDNSRYPNHKSENKIRKAIYQHNLKKASKLVNLFYNGPFLKSKKVLKKIINKLKNKGIQLHKKIRHCLKNKDYIGILNLLEDVKSKYHLSMLDETILKIVKDILQIQATKEIPEKKKCLSSDIFAAINANDYTGALLLNENFKKKSHYNLDGDILNILLNDIVELIRKIKLEQKNDLHRTEFDNYVNSITVDEIFSMILKGDIFSAFNVLNVYMNRIGSEQFTFLIKGLIKINILENNTTFEEIRKIILRMSTHTFTFNSENYVNLFYKAISLNEFTKARIYLTILEDASKLDLTDISFEFLKGILESAEQIAKQHGLINNNRPAKQIAASTFHNNCTNGEEYVMDQNEKLEVFTYDDRSVEVLQGEFVESNKTSMLNENEIKNVRAKYEYIKNSYRIVLIEPKNESKIPSLLDLIGEYKNSSAFTIGSGDNTRIVLIYSSPEFKNGNKKDLMKLADTQYANGDFLACIKNYLKLIHVSGPSSKIFARLGLANLKLHNNDFAIMYLTIATELNKENNRKYDYSNVIAKLQGIISKNERKPYFTMTEEDFEENPNDNFGIDNIDQITYYVEFSQVDVETICKCLNMSGEQIDLVRLIYARQYYTQGDFEVGDAFLKAVEQSENKTTRTAKILNQIRANKKFYKNRAQIDDSERLFIMKPKASRKVN